MPDSESILRVGHGSADITPSPGITLSGFGARCDRPSTGIDDPLSVHAIVFEQAGKLITLLVFDLCGIGPELTDELNSSIQKILPPGAAPPLLWSTHTHSAPAAVELIGCGRIERSYWDQVIRASTKAARDAVASLRPATLRFTTRDVGGIAYNRRHVLDTGRVVMTTRPGDRVVKTGPTWDEMLIARFDDDRGEGIVGLCAWAAHPVVVCTQQISADYPGELRQRLADRCGFPFVFLQGACADINMPFKDQNRPEMLADVDQLMQKIENVTWDRSARTSPVHVTRETVELSYQPLMSRDQFRAVAEGMETLATTGSVSPDIAATLANILNMPPPREADAKLRHIARSLAAWARRWLDRYDTAPKMCDLSIGVLQIGDLVFPFAGGEVFCETGLKLREALRESDRIIFPIGYASPFIGYLSTDDALREGGYESAHAYRFFGAPAPLSSGSEMRILESLAALRSD